MTPDEVVRQLERITRELDLAVFTLEGDPRDPAGWPADRKKLRRDLERLRDHLEELTRALG